MVQELHLLIGNGKVLAALTIPRPDKIGMMQKWRKWI
jgi:hypothetical protein